MRKPGLNTIGFFSRVFATKDRVTIKSVDPSLIPFLQVIKNELGDDDILIVISKKNLDYVYGEVKNKLEEVEDFIDSMMDENK